MGTSLHKLTLTRFRNYEAARLDIGGAPVVILVGENGAGKTNILESVSLLSPGRGLRGADLQDMRNRNFMAGEDWAVVADIETAQGERVRIGTGLARDGKRRVVRIDGEDSRGQSALAGKVSAVWLTPQMDRLFQEGPAARRKFFDRLVFAFDPAHAGRIARYEKNLRARLRLLSGEGKADPKWLSALEMQLAADAVAIAAARVLLTGHLGRQIEKQRSEESFFPAPAVSMTGWVETEITRRPALDVEEDLMERLSSCRDGDAAEGRTREGVHRSDVSVAYADRGMPASECSTGEQKGLLLSIVLAHARMLQAEQGTCPLILLDEVAAHLDVERRMQLFAILKTLPAQIWLTGTEAAVFSDLRDVALFFDVSKEDGAVLSRARGAAA